MKTAAELLREKDEELELVMEMQDDALEQRQRLQLFEKKLEKHIRELEKHIKELEKEIHDLEIKWQEEILREKEGRHE